MFKQLKEEQVYIILYVSSVYLQVHYEEQLPLRQLLIFPKEEFVTLVK